MFEFLNKLKNAGLQVSVIDERIAVPGFQPSGAGTLVSVKGKHQYQIRLDAADLLSAIEFRPEGRALEILGTGWNTISNWDWITDRIIQSEFAS